MKTRALQVFIVITIAIIGFGFPETAYTQVAGQNTANFPNAAAGNYISIPSSTSLNITGAIAVEAWVNITSTVNGGAIVCKGTGGGGESYCLDLGGLNNAPRFFTRGTAGPSGLICITANSTALSTGVWHHLAGVNTGSTVKLYVDGIDVTGTATCTGAGIVTNSSPVTIGARQSASAGFDLYIQGMIDEVRIWNVARLQTDVQNDMFRELPTPYSSNLKAYYQFNGSSGQYNDLTTNGNNGTVGGTVTNVTSTAPIPFYTTSSGAWGTAATWAANLVPPTTTYTDVWINNSISLPSAYTLRDVKIANSATFSDAGNQLTSTGTLNLTSGTFKLGAGTATTWPGFTTRNISSGTTVEYAATAPQTISSTPAYQNLTISGASNKTAANNLTIGGDLNISAGATLDLSTFTANRSSSGGILTVAGTLLLGGTTGGQTGSNFPTNFSTLTMTGGTVNYNAAGTQTVYSSPSYNNLTTSVSGTKTLGASTTVNGTLTVKAATTLGLSSFNLGTPTSVVLENGSTASTISGSGTLTPGGDITVNYISGSGSSATISCPVALSATRTFTVANETTTASDLTVSSVISGTGGITKAGAGTLTLTNSANIYSGSTTVTTGELRLNPVSVTASFASQIILNGGTLSTTNITVNTVFTNSSTLQLTDNSTITLQNNVHSLKFAASSGVSWTANKRIVITGWQGTYNSQSGSAGKIYIGSDGSGLTKAQLVQIKFFDGTNYYYATQLSSSGEVIPTSEKTCAFWYKGDGTTQYSSNTWYDETPYGNNAVRSSGTITLINNNINFNPSLTFTSVDRGMLTNSSTTVKSFVIVTDPTVITDYAGLIGATSDDGIRLAPGGNSWLDVNNNDWSYYINGTGGSRINGVSGWTHNSNWHIVNQYRSAALASQYYIGGYFSGRSYGGIIAEVMAFTGDVPNQDRVESYQAVKFGITLGHDYAAGDGTSIYAISGYTHDVAGLGNDATYGLNQKVSSSINIASGSSRVVMATTNNFLLSNQDVSRTSLTNGQYLIWGNDAGATSGWIASGSYQTVTRKWKTVNTGSVSAVYFQIDLTGYPAASSGNYALLVDDDGNFSNGGTTEYLMTHPSGNLYTANIAFPSGSYYFTVADCIKPPSAGAITGSASVCKEQTGVAYSVPVIATSSSYTWAYSGTGATINGNTRSITIDFASNATSGNLTVMGTNACGNGTVSSNFAITVNPLPATGLTVGGTGSVCSGAGTNITVASSVSGTNYQLRDAGNNNIGSPVAGTGGTINLPTGNLTSNITFNVLATIASTGCSAQLTGTATVTINPLPATDLTVGGTGSVCSGTGTNITVASSVSGTNYQLRDAGNNNIGSPVAGTSGTINLPTGNLTSNTTFNVLATIASTGCSAQLTGTATVTVNARKTISGTFYYYNIGGDIALQAQDITVKLYLSSDQTHSSQIGSDVTPNASGFYQFTDLCPALNYDIVATSTHTTAGSVNTTDAAQVNYYGVNSNSIELVRFNAGDVGTSALSGDRLLTATDAGRIQSHFVNGTDFDNTWTFWKKGDMISSIGTSPQYSSVTLSVGSDLTANMYGLCTGDFNLSFNPSLAKSASTTLFLIYSADRQVSNNKEFDLPLHIVNASEVGAISLILNFPAGLVEVKDVVMNGAGGQLDWAVKGNELRIGWHSMNPLRFEANAELLTLKLKSTDAFTKGNSIRLSLAPDPLNELADDQYNVIGDAVLSVDVIDAAPVGIEEQTPVNGLTLSNHPNPFNSYTIFEYSLPFDGKVTLEIRNLLGVTEKILVNEMQASGGHSLKFDAGSLPSGIYTATIRLRNDSDMLVRTIKLVSSR